MRRPLGIDRPKLRRLRAPARDAEALADVLRDPEIGGFEVALASNENGAPGGGTGWTGGGGGANTWSKAVRRSVPSLRPRVSKNSSAVPRSLRRTAMSMTAPNSTSIGRKYGSGGMARKPMRMRALVRSVRVSAR